MFGWLRVVVISTMALTIAAVGPALGNASRVYRALSFILVITGVWILSLHTHNPLPWTQAWGVQPFSLTLVLGIASFLTFQMVTLRQRLAARTPALIDVGYLKLRQLQLILTGLFIVADGVAVIRFMQSPTWLEGTWILHCTVAAFYGYYLASNRLILTSQGLWDNHGLVTWEELAPYNWEVRGYGLRRSLQLVVPFEPRWLGGVALVRYLCVAGYPLSSAQHDQLDPHLQKGLQASKDPQIVGILPDTANIASSPET